MNIKKIKQKVKAWKINIQEHIKNLLKKKMSLNDISEVVNLNLDEIKKILKEIKKSEVEEAGFK